jgi:CBS domain-containing protein
VGALSFATLAGYHIAGTIARTDRLGNCWRENRLAEECRMTTEQRSPDIGPIASAGHNPATVVGDIMTAPVISVAPDTPVRVIAQLLLEKGISAVPIVDGSGHLVGIVSEGDLLGRSGQDRLARHKWWLAAVAAGEEPTIDYSPKDFVRPAKEVMRAPVITIGTEAPIQQAVDMLRLHRVKRLPVLRDGNMVGIVSRADLLRILAATPPKTRKPPRRGGRDRVGAMSSS